MAYWATASIKKPVSSSDETALREKVVELHAHDVSAFDTESLLASIEGILNHVMPGVDATGEEQDLIDEAGKLRRIIAPPGPDCLPDTLPYLLHQITCVLNCKCSGGDGHASALEILQLLANYTWEAKIVIILASFVVEYGEYRLVAKLNKSDPLAKLVAMLKQIPDDSDEIFDVMKSKFETIINLVRVSIETTRFIANFGCLPSKHITNDEEPMVVALNQIPIAVYWMTRAVVACASEYSVIVGKGESTTSYTETTSITSLERQITTIRTTLKTQLDVCNLHIAEKKQIKYVEKLKVMFSQRTVYIDNQKILQAIIKKKDGSRPLSCGPQVETKMGVEALKGKTVLLLISDLEISHEEITKISHFYNESRTKSEYQYEIVWLPIVEKIEETKEFEEKIKELKCKMPWHALEHPSLIKPGFVKYVREEWRYSKKSIMVSIDQRGKVAHQNAFHMMWTWGNTVYPFTHRRESEIWSRKEWSLKLLVEESDEQMSTWINEDKLICLFGGDDSEWIQDFVRAAAEVASAAQIKLEMVYIYKKNMKQEDITKITEIVSKHSLVWEKTTSTYFWKRMECMLYSKVHHVQKITTAKESGDQILTEVISMLTLGDHDKGWGLISQGAGSGLKKIAKAKGDVLLKAFGEFSSWSTVAKEVGFATALHEHLLLLGKETAEHHCNWLTLPGIEDIPGIMVCAECQRPMEKYIMYRCSAADPGWGNGGTAVPPTKKKKLISVNKF